MSAVFHAFRVFEEVARRQPVGVSAAAAALEMSKSTTQRALRALAEEGWIEPAAGDSSKWVITAKAFTLGSMHAGLGSARELARGPMRELVRTCGETVHLSLLDGRHLVGIDIVESQAPVRVHAKIGDRFPLHSTASGIAILAALSPDSARALLEGAPRLEQLTEKTSTALPEILAQVERARVNGYAVTAGTRHEEISAIGVALLDRDGAPFASMSISAPSSRLPQSLHAELGQRLRAAAEECSGIYNR